MAVDVLQQFLSRRLIDIGADDSRLERIREATGDLRDAILAAPRKAIAFVFAAIDPKVSGDQSAVLAAAAALEAKWSTYRGAFADTPVNLFRCMIADALSQAAEKDVRVAAALAYLARNLLPYSVLSGEEAIWSELINQVEAKTETEATREWDSSGFTAAKLQIKVPAVEIKIVKGKLDAAALGATLQSASGPHNQQNQAYPNNPNPHWPNSGANWSWDFAPRAATAIGAAVDKVAISAEVDVDAAFKSLSEGVVAYGAALAKGLSGSSEGTRRRTQLLWWKEALYSPLAQQSYRDLEGAIRGALMALDLYRDLPTYHTRSVEFFLRETVRGAEEADPKPISIKSWLSTLEAAPLVSFLKEEAANVKAAAEDGDLLLSSIALGSPLSPRFAAIELAPPQFAVWMLRELQVLHITKPAN